MKRTSTISDPTGSLLFFISKTTQSEIGIDFIKFLGLLLIGLLSISSQPCRGQDNSTRDSQPEKINSGNATIIIDTGTKQSEPTFLFTASANAQITVNDRVATQTVDVITEFIQGRPAILALEIFGVGTVENVEGDSIEAWSIRRKSGKQFLDLQIASEADDANFKIANFKILATTPVDDFPGTVSVLNIGAGNAIGFDSKVSISYAKTVSGKLIATDGFTPIATQDESTDLQTTSGGMLRIELNRRGAELAPITLSETTLVGQLLPEENSVRFELAGTADVTEPNATITILSGQAAISQLPKSKAYSVRLTLNDQNKHVYQLQFANPGKYPFSIPFITPAKTLKDQWIEMHFQVATSAVVPLKLKGFAQDIEFANSKTTILPILQDSDWIGFLPANGNVHLRWKNARTKKSGKLFFRTSATVEAIVGPGLLRQDHSIEYNILQGELDALQLSVEGPGEILSVEGAGIISWKTESTPNSDNRAINISLRQSIKDAIQLTIKTQTTLGDFPEQVRGTNITPQNAIRHSGYVRIRSSGSVRIEPRELTGLTQLAPDQFPGSKSTARQTFVYRHPAEEYQFSIIADQIQPEISINELALYQLSETDRIINANIELDIREAPIRDWAFQIPADYSVVSMSNPYLADYVVGNLASGKPRTPAAENEDPATSNSYRDIKAIFGQDIRGRQLIRLQLEKNQPANAGLWKLSQLRYPDAKSVRGDIGIVGSPGYRITTVSTENLAEKPLSYFPATTPNLQQAFRVRANDWQATMQIEALQRSVQADIFHLYSLSQGTIYGSALVNYFIAGAPTSQWRITVPQSLGNLIVEGQDIRNWRREGDTLIVSLHQPVMGPYTLLLTFEEKASADNNSFEPGLIQPLDVQGDRGFIQVVSPMQVKLTTELESKELLVLDPLELPAEFRLLSTAPALGTWQYTSRPFNLKVGVEWFQPGTTAPQVVEFSEANSRVSPDGQLVTDIIYYVKSRGQQTLKLQLPSEPVRLWAASVNGQPVNARTAGGETWVPLPGATDPNVPIEVNLRLGKPSTQNNISSLELPTISAPVLKTEWEITGDENHILIPLNGTVSPTEPVGRSNGFNWVSSQALIQLSVVSFLAFLGWISLRNHFLLALLALLFSAIAAFISVATALYSLVDIEPIQPLRISLPVLSAGEQVQLNVQNVPTWYAYISPVGLTMIVVGSIALLISILAKWTFKNISNGNRNTLRVAGFGMVAVGLLMQHGGAGLFFLFLALTITIFLALPSLSKLFSRIQQIWKTKTSTDETPRSTENATSVVTSIVLFFVTLVSLSSIGTAEQTLDLNSEQNKSPHIAADQISETWEISRENHRLTVRGEIQFTGQPGDQFVLLREPAILTSFDANGIVITKRQTPNGLVYLATIDSRVQSDTAKENDIDDDDNNDDDNNDKEESKSESDSEESVETKAETEDDENVGTDDLYDNQSNGDLSNKGDNQQTTIAAEFSYQLKSIDVQQGVSVLTGPAAVHTIHLDCDAPDWAVSCEKAVWIETPQANIETPAQETNSKQNTTAKILLGPGPATVLVQPKSRDLNQEETKFFTEISNLYIVGPGVVDGRHQIAVRTAQGRITDLIAIVPESLTVSDVKGPIGNWQFDADKRSLQMEIKSDASSDFLIVVETQRGLDALPTQLELRPLQTTATENEIGLVAVAFGPDAQPKTIETSQMSRVNIGDFDSSLVVNSQSVIHRVFRYGGLSDEQDSEPKITATITEVAPEVRVTSRQALSINDERTVLSVQFIAEITRAGLFQLSMPLPDGLEVESLSGDALDHWSEITDEEQRKIILHLNGKTTGSHSFALTFTGSAPKNEQDWQIPQFRIFESGRQTGELVISPMTGMRLRTISRQNVSEVDPRSIGGKNRGSLAFRLLQKDWKLSVGIERLTPWVTGQLLHSLTLREGQTRSTITANFDIQNAAIRSLRIELPLIDDDEIKSLRITGKAVSDFVRTEPNSNIWEIQLKRRAVGKLPLKIEFERRGDRMQTKENLQPVAFPSVKQLAYFYSVRAGGRIDILPPKLTQGWQLADWNNVPIELRQSTNDNPPAITLRATSPPGPLTIEIARHSLAESLKLRVVSGNLTTVLSPTGDQLTAVDVEMEVIQRSSLTVTLPAGGNLFSIFVNGESVHSVRKTDTDDTWQFFVLPGIDDRTATLRFVYSLSGTNITDLRLTSPQLNVPLENVTWSIIAPTDLQLSSSDGSLEMIGSNWLKKYDRKNYLSKTASTRKDQADEANQLLARANQLLQAGQQSKAQWAFNNLANRYGLDAASNEDARVQLENLQTQQAIVGLNSRRQRLFLDNAGGQNADVGINSEQFLQAANRNLVLQSNETNFRPQDLGQMLSGNTSDEIDVLQRIAGRLVQHQRTTEPAPQAIVISVPEEGTVYRFRRAVQVTENVPLELDLQFTSAHKPSFWQWLVLVFLLTITAMAISFRKQASASNLKNEE